MSSAKLSWAKLSSARPSPA
ncbi:MAG TPA: hypothetical protein VMT85_16500 [Thermoanaerobaculia bacterium]|nr:hypothetical protein [Thermoanaerobaculia bacterium]